MRRGLAQRLSVSLFAGRPKPSGCAHVEVVACPPSPQGSRLSSPFQAMTATGEGAASGLASRLRRGESLGILLSRANCPGRTLPTPLVRHHCFGQGGTPKPCTVRPRPVCLPSRRNGRVERAALRLCRAPSVILLSAWLVPASAPGSSLPCARALPRSTRKTRCSASTLTAVCDGALFGWSRIRPSSSSLCERPGARLSTRRRARDNCVGLLC